MERVTFDFYIEEYRGATIMDVSTFDRLLTEAQAFVDNLIIDRHNLTFETVKERYKKAICAVTDEIYRQEQNDAEGKTSESVGEVSVSYAQSTSETKAADCKAKARIYLTGTGLLTRCL